MRILVLALINEKTNSSPQIKQFVDENFRKIKSTSLLALIYEKVGTKTLSVLDKELLSLLKRGQERYPTGSLANWWLLLSLDSKLAEVEKRRYLADETSEVTEAISSILATPGLDKDIDEKLVEIVRSGKRGTISILEMIKVKGLVSL